MLTSVASGSVRARVRVSKSPKRIFTLTVRAVSPRAPQPRARAIGEAHELALALRRRCAGRPRTSPRRRSTSHRARERPRAGRRCGRARAGGDRGAEPSAPTSDVLVERRDVADRPQAHAFELRQRRGPDTPEPRHRQRRQERLLGSRLDDEHAVGLGEVARELRQELRRRDARPTGTRPASSSTRRRIVAAISRRCRACGARRPRRGTPRRSTAARRAARSTRGSPSPRGSSRRSAPCAARGTPPAGTPCGPGPSASPSARRTRAPRSSRCSPLRGCRDRRRSPACPRSAGSSSCSTAAKNASRSTCRIVASSGASVHGCGTAHDTHRRRASCRTRRSETRRRCPAPSGRAATPPAAHPPTARTTRAAPRTRSAGTNAASTTMPSGSSTTHVAFERDREVHLAAHPPAHVGRVRAHLVERPAPLAHAQAGLLFDLAGETGEQVGVVGVDHAAGRAPVLEAAPAEIAHEQHAVGRLEQSSGDGPLAHGRQSRASLVRGGAPVRSPRWLPRSRRSIPTCPAAAHSRDVRRHRRSRGALGGLIGYSLVATTCPDTPTRRRAAARADPRLPRRTCRRATLKELGGALVGTILAAIGAATIAILVLRAQSEWRGHAPTAAPRARPRRGPERRRSGERDPAERLRERARPRRRPASIAVSRRKSRNQSPVSTSWLA